MLATVLRVVGLGAVVAAVSEIWFYPVALTSHVILLCVLYGPLVYAGWLAMAHARVSTWKGAFWGACLAGFLIEGIPVPVLYEALPFTVFWTSISWHALVSMGLGLWGFRRLTALGSIPVMALWFLGCGAYLGAWSVELWSLREDGSPWRWTPTDEFATQMLVGWAVFVAGHALLDVAARQSTRPWRGEVGLFALLVAGFFAVGMLPAVFPLSLVLPVLTGLAIWLMHRDRAAEGNTAPFLVRLSNLRVPLVGYGASLLVPATSIAVYSWLMTADLRLESSALHIMWAGPVSLGLVVWSAWRLSRQRRDLQL